MKKLFGGGGDKPKAPPPKDPQETINTLNAQCENVKKRINVLENRTTALK